jgi:divalent metal cation (Fe/Co/Zn/Cd) transporter
MRTLTMILAITIMLAVLVGVVVYAYEERWGRFAYFVGEAIAAILVIGLISWSVYKRGRKSSGR